MTGWGVRWQRVPRAHWQDLTWRDLGMRMQADQRFEVETEEQAAQARVTMLNRRAYRARVVSPREYELEHPAEVTPG